jgi:hemolysin III
MSTKLNSSHEDGHEEFSLPLFLVTVVATLAVLFFALRLLAPEVWSAQWTAPLWKGLTAFAIISLVNCFLEYFFHRYLLHTAALPLVRRLYRQHTLHHALTHIVRRPARDGRSILHVENRFPIIEPEQGEASFFPWYALTAFSLVLTPLFVGLHLLWPGFPWFVGGYAALAVSLCLYEVLHAINHWSLDRWSPLLTHRFWGPFWRPIYGFHVRHHAVHDCNESISGFFGLPVADWVFRTCIIPRTVYADGEASDGEMFRSPRPVALIAWLDRLASAAVRRRRAESTSGTESTQQENSRSHPGSAEQARD